MIVSVCCKLTWNVTNTIFIKLRFCFIYFLFKINIKIFHFCKILVECISREVSEFSKNFQRNVIAGFLTQKHFQLFKRQFCFLTLLGLGGLKQPVLFSDGYFSMKKGVWRSQISWLFLIHYELSENQKIFFWFFTVFWGDLEGAGWFSPPPLSSNIQKPRSIRVNNHDNVIEQLSYCRFFLGPPKFLAQLCLCP